MPGRVDLAGRSCAGRARRTSGCASRSTSSCSAPGIVAAARCIAGAIAGALGRVAARVEDDDVRAAARRPRTPSASAGSPRRPTCPGSRSSGTSASTACRPRRRRTASARSRPRSPASGDEQQNEQGERVVQLLLAGSRPRVQAGWLPSSLLPLGCAVFPETGANAETHRLDPPPRMAFRWLRSRDGTSSPACAARAHSC